jgi:hypothetical protein
MTTIARMMPACITAHIHRDSYAEAVRSIRSILWLRPFLHVSKLVSPGETNDPFSKWMPDQGEMADITAFYSEGILHPCVPRQGASSGRMHTQVSAHFTHLGMETISERTTVLSRVLEDRTKSQRESSHRKGVFIDPNGARVRTCGVHADVHSFDLREYPQG